MSQAAKQLGCRNQQSNPSAPRRNAVTPLTWKKLEGIFGTAEGQTAFTATLLQSPNWSINRHSRIAWAASRATGRVKMRIQCLLPRSYSPQNFSLFQSRHPKANWKSYKWAISGHIPVMKETLPSLLAI